jgi:hypothetical protein
MYTTLKGTTSIWRACAGRHAEAASATGERRDRVRKEISEPEKTLARFQSEQAEFSRERFESLPDRAKRLHDRALTFSSGDPDFRKLIESEVLDILLIDLVPNASHKFYSIEYWNPPCGLIATWTLLSDSPRVIRLRIS